LTGTAEASAEVSSNTAGEQMTVCSSRIVRPLS
jgi:hypothetical protein